MRHGVILVSFAMLWSGCTAIGFGLGWRSDRAHNQWPLPTETAEARIGENVRIRHNGQTLRGTLVSADSTGLVLEQPGEPPTFYSMDRLQSARYERRRTTGRIIGGLVGLGLDVVAAVSLSNSVVFFPDTSPY